MTIQEIIHKKMQGQKITVLTAYDYPIALMADEAGVDVVLVGDSLANVVLGLSSTREVGMQEMIHHTKAVVRAVKKAVVIGDLPFDAYQINPKAAVDNAKQFMDIGCQAVKLEWFDQCPATVEAIVKAGIPVMGHVGLTPQTASAMKVQGKDAASAQTIIDSSKILQDMGCFSIVLECIPQEVAQKITQQLKISTIGIGAGSYCDGQVLVSYDILGLFDRYQPKFSKKYLDLAPMIIKAFKQYKDDVQNGNFPDHEHSFHMSALEVKKL